MRIYLGGEGVTDLGCWAHEPAYRKDLSRIGVIEALLRALERDYHVAGATVWCRIHKYRAGDHRSPEVRNVQGLALDAFEARCDAVVFVRDRDRDPDREQQIAQGITLAKDLVQTVVGGLAIEETEAWILAILGVRGVERLANPKLVLQQRGVAGVSAMVDRVLDRGVGDLPDDVLSLRKWLDAVQDALPERETDRPT